MDKLIKERAQVRRLFTSSLRALKDDLEYSSVRKDEIIAIYNIFEDRANRLFKLDEIIKDLWLDNEELDEDAFAKDLDIVEGYRTQWIEMKTKYERFFSVSSDEVVPTNSDQRSISSKTDSKIYTDGLTPNSDKKMSNDNKFDANVSSLETIDDHTNVPAMEDEVADPLEKPDPTSEKKAVLKEVGWFALKTAAISSAVLGGVAVAVPVIGFTAGGVAAGSLAAAYQSAVLGGTIASGRAFAALQSVGVLGLAAGTQARVVAVTAGVHTAIKKLRREKDGEEVNPENGEKEKFCSCGKVMQSNKDGKEIAFICNCEKDKKFYLLC